jgi:hypothetical protein
MAKGSAFIPTLKDGDFLLRPSRSYKLNKHMKSFTGIKNINGQEYLREITPYYDKEKKQSWWLFIRVLKCWVARVEADGAGRPGALLSAKHYICSRTQSACLGPMIWQEIMSLRFSLERLLTGYSANVI